MRDAEGEKRDAETPAEKLVETAAAAKGKGSVKLVAKSIFKFGGKAEMDRNGPTGRWLEEPKFVYPGEPFEAKGDDAEQYILMGVAAMPDDFAADERSAETPDDKIQRLRRDLAEAEGTTSDIGRAHINAQAKEIAAVNDALEKQDAKKKEKPKTATEREAEKGRANVESSQPSRTRATAGTKGR